jgi:hypothetical protein
MYFYNGTGVATPDFNADGLNDVFFAANQQPNQLNLNRGQLRFEKLSQGAGRAANCALIRDTRRITPIC